MKNKNSQKLIINYTDTIGLELSRKESPSWADSYGVTESLARKYHAKNIAEVGVARGHHSAHLLEAIPGLRVYAIDPWGLFENDHISMWKQEQNEVEKIYRKVMDLLRPFGDRAVIIRSTSEKAVAQINELLDMVFIDADHTYKSVKSDINLWWNKLRVGGIISGHDYNHTHHPGVTLAVNEFFENINHEVTGEIGNVWWVQKKSGQQPKNEIILNKIFRKAKYKTLLYKIIIAENVKKNSEALYNKAKRTFKSIVGEQNYIRIKKKIIR